MNRKVLIVTAMTDAEECARTLRQDVGADIEIAPNRRAGLALLRQEEFAVVVLEESLAETDGEWAEEMREAGASAMPLQVNFAITGCSRLGREIKGALARRDREHAIARRQARAELENELKSSVTGLLLESQLALQEPSVSATLEPKLRHLVELAGAIRERLRSEIERGV